MTQGLEEGQGIPEEYTRPPLETPSKRLSPEQVRQAIDSSYLDLVKFVSKYLPPDLKSRLEDIVQTTLVKAYQHAEQFEGRNSAGVKSWLFAIARNAWLSELRHTSRETSLDEPDQSDNGDEDHSLKSKIAAPGPSLERREISRLLSEEVLKKIKDYPAIHRDILLAVAADPEAPHEEMAKKLNISEKVFKSRLHRARELLKADFPHGSVM